MSNSIESILAEAHDLIEQDRIDDAQELLQPLKEAEQDNPDFWWVYLHAIRDPEEAQTALDHLVELDPQYPGIETLTGTPSKSPTASSGGIQRLGSSSILDDFDDDEWPEDDFEDLDLEEQPTPVKKTRRRRSWLLPSVALLAIIAVIVLALLLLGGGNDGDDKEPTTVAQGAPTSTQSLIPTVDEATEDVVITEEVIATEVPTEATIEQPTDEPVETQEVIPTDTEVPPTQTDIPEPTETETPAASDTPTPPSLSEVFSGFQLGSESGRLINDSAMGQVFAVSVCSQQDRPLRQILNDAMVLLATEQSVAPQEANGLAVELVNCDLGQPINIVGVPLDIAQSFAAGSIQEAEFLAQWRAIGLSTP